MINPQWLELPMSRTNFHGPKDVRALEVRLSFYLFSISHSSFFIYLFIFFVIFNVYLYGKVVHVTPGLMPC